jgi:hypothetical protein
MTKLIIEFVLVSCALTLVTGLVIAAVHLFI